MNRVVRLFFWLSLFLLCYGGTLNRSLGQIFPHWDLIVHASVFLFLSLLWVLGYGRPVLCVLLLFSVGVMIEVYQGLVLPMRTADPHDIAANLIGILAGVMLASLPGIIRGMRAR
ncbi:hypothetical protein Maes01_01586 [Microbulbifer aestuariivivens]|uniref:VanZ family protein n=1 Tax=Microbulbifer aestuariivivens TaxID=1908308 RepID=A0ABP9WSA8_9GAMM